MTRILFTLAAALVASALLPSCTTKTEVVALQPATRSSTTVRYSAPAPAVRTQTVVKKTGNPKPSPWATDVVNAYDQ